MGNGVGIEPTAALNAGQVAFEAAIFEGQRDQRAASLADQQCGQFGGPATLPGRQR